MRFDTPLSTVWPAAIALALLVVFLVIGRRHFAVPRAWRAVAAIAIFVRLLAIPALDLHVFDGHEADYFDLFQGVVAPSRGGTVMVPPMQWFWWLLGQVLPAWPWLPVVIMGIISIAAIGLLAGAVGTLGGRAAGWAAAIVLVVHPTHAVWSTSAYNVMLPHFFGCLALFSVARISKRSGSLGVLPWITAGAAALMVGLRLDTASLGFVLAVLPLWIRPPSVSFFRRLGQLLPAGLTGLALAALAAWPLLWPGELPGAGDRVVSFAINVGLFDYYAPFDALSGASVVALATLLAFLARPRVTAVFVIFAVGHHLLLSTFDDFGSRHTLPTVISLVWIFGAAVVRLPKIGWTLTAIAGLLCSQGLQDLGERYYGGERAFSAVLDRPPWGALPRVQWPGGVDPACGWVVEDHRVRRGRVASHFNLIQPDEEASLRASDGCLRWCFDVQDWRWSSRGVRDRAIRLRHLFELRPEFVVEDASTGYACLAFNVGLRRFADGVSTLGTTTDHEHNNRANQPDSPLP